jgi:two-component system, NarL family, response regulator DesR
MVLRASSSSRETVLRKIILDKDGGTMEADARGRSGYLQRAMESGAVGFLLKDAPAAKLAVALRRVMAGERVVDPDLALPALSEGSNPLTPREREVLAASLFGASLADIAARLVLSEGTVRNHLSTAMQKLGAQNRMEAARLAEQKGWL